jgi:hypothetical protein
VYCGAAAAPLKCSTCLATMYCDAACSKKHWRHGGGVSEVAELLRCVYCGTDGAARKCSLCLEARYCDTECLARHWREGGGCVGGGYDAPHKTACPRTHAD